MFWSLSKLLIVVVAFCMMVSLDTVAGQKYREEVQREGFRPKKITLQKCNDAFKQADSSHTLCWRNDHSKLVTGTVDDHNEWCTKQIRKFDSTKDVAGEYKMSDCKMLTLRAEAADERYNFLHGLYMEEAGVKNDPKGWLDTANSFLLWGTRKVVQGVTLGNIKKPEIPPGSVFSNARVAAMTFCKAAKRSVCTNGDNSALVRTIERFETALEKVEHATNVVTKWYAEYDHSTSFTVKALKVTKFAGYCAAVAAAGLSGPVLDFP